MNMKLGIILMLMFSGSAGFAQQKDSAVIKEIILLEEKRFEAQVNKDYDFLEKIFAEDLVYIHSTGIMHTKKQYIQSIKEGTSAYKKIDIDKQDRKSV